MARSLIITLLVFSYAIGQGQITINEYSAANLERFLDNYGRTDDWIELYNDSDVDVDISGYHLSDKSSKPGKWEIPAGTMIPAKGYLVFWCSGRDESCDGHYHTNFKLSQTTGNETLLLTDRNENIINEIEVQWTLVESSWCRSTDGGEEWMVCTAPTLRSSNNGAPMHSGYTETPAMDKNAGFYEGELTVSISNEDENATLRYTTNGTNPTPSSPIYTDPITLTSTTVIKARAFPNDPSRLPGKMDFNTYFIDEDFTLAVFSVAADQVQDLANGQGEIIPIGSLEYFNTDKEREATSFGSLNRHGQDSWALDHRSLDWVSRDEMGYSKAVKAKLFSFSDRDEYQKFMFRNSGDDNYPAINDNSHEGSTHVRDEYVQTLAMEGGLKLDQRAVERVILFLNGEYWGVYGMRDRPVDHDYTDYYYDQGKYDIQYLSTWGDTELEYGGQQALNDWYRLRDFILENDMSIEENYRKVEDELNVLSLMDYMIVNLNCVASDWLNYNTGWWRGTNPDGDHKKWGYILWDLDATFDYYINYSGVPDISPNAKPCDIDDISDYMDTFFGTGAGDVGPGGVSCAVSLDAETCASIINGSSPYPATDATFQATINQDNACCNQWDDICQAQYDELESGSGSIENCPSVLSGQCPYPASDPVLAQVIAFQPQCCENWAGFCNSIYDLLADGGSGGDGGVNGPVGKHEKIFLKLQEESPIFRQLYYGRQADLQNTVYTCENMLTTLDRMIGVIAPEMPRQIERWGGTMAEWESNVDRLRNFITQRCERFDEGMTECFGLTGPHMLTLMVEPDGVGEIDLNTLDIEEFPWSGAYYGGMENTIKARAFEDEYDFSHWEVRGPSVISPDINTRRASISLSEPDTLVAVFTDILSGVSELDGRLKMTVSPNPTSGQFSVRYELEQATEVRISVMNMMGQEVLVPSNVSGLKGSGIHREEITIDKSVGPSGMYIVRVQAGTRETSHKISVIH